MNFWQFLDRQIGRLPGWPNGRGLVGFAMVVMSVMVLWMIKSDPQLRTDDFFKTLAGAIVITGLLNSVVAFFFGQNSASERFTTQAADRHGQSPTGQKNDPVHVEEE